MTLHLSAHQSRHFAKCGELLVVVPVGEDLSSFAYGGPGLDDSGPEIKLTDEYTFFLREGIPWEGSRVKQIRCPYGAVGAEWWGQEDVEVVGHNLIHYPATGETLSLADYEPDDWKECEAVWLSDSREFEAATMPKWAARHTGLITSVRMGRVQSLTGAELLAMGYVPDEGICPCEGLDLVDLCNVREADVRAKFQADFITRHGAAAWAEDWWCWLVGLGRGETS